MTRTAFCSAPVAPRSRSDSAIDWSAVRTGATAPLGRCAPSRRPLAGLVLAAASVTLLLLPAPASASRNMWSVFEDHTALVRSTPSQRQRALEEIRLHMGADTLRIEVKWNEVAPLPAAR